MCHANVSCYWHSLSKTCLISHFRYTILIWLLCLRIRVEIICLRYLKLFNHKNSVYGMSFIKQIIKTTSLKPIKNWAFLQKECCWIVEQISPAKTVSFPELAHLKFSMKYIHRFLKEQKFEYGELSGSKTFFPKTKLEEIWSEFETHYRKYENKYIVNFDESMFSINEPVENCLVNEVN